MKDLSTVFAAKTHKCSVKNNNAIQFNSFITVLDNRKIANYKHAQRKDKKHNNI
jgi:hypothetical protein